MTRRDLLLLIVLGATWGAVYPLTGVALRELSPALVVAARTALGALVLLPFTVRRHTLTLARNRTGALLFAAATQATVPLVLLTIGQQHVSASIAGILAATQPLFTALFLLPSAARLRLQELLGVLLGFLGVTLLFVRDLSTAGTTLWGGAAVLTAAAFYGGGAAYVQHALPDMPPLITAATAMTVSAVALAPFAAGAATLPDASTAAWLIALGSLGTGAALVLYYALISRIGAVRATIASYLAPGFAILYSTAFLHEHPDTTVFVGLALILFGSGIAATAKIERSIS